LYFSIVNEPFHNNAIRQLLRLLPLDAVIDAVDLFGDLTGCLVEVQQAHPPAVGSRSVGVFVGPVLLTPA